MHSFLGVVFLLVSMLAGRVLALNITVGGSVGTVPANEFLTLDGADAVFMSECQAQCMPATNAIMACGDSNACLCDSATVTNITACEQCYFAQVIAANARPTDPRTGSTPALTAYVAACAAADIVVPAAEATLTVPPGWDGPLGVGMGTLGTAFTLIAGVFLGTGAIYVVNTM